jgi:hypothetical protein
VLVQNLRNLGQNILLEKRYRDALRGGRHAHWHTVERVGSAAKGPVHQQMTLWDIRVSSA